MAEQEKEREDGLVEETGWRVGPEAVFRGHKGRVGRAIWDKTIGGDGEGKKIWSCGWDGSVRGWDVETQVNFLIKVSEQRQFRRVSSREVGSRPSLL